MVRSPGIKTHRIRSGLYLTPDRRILITRIPPGRELPNGWYVALVNPFGGPSFIVDGPCQTLKDARRSARDLEVRLAAEEFA